MNGTLRGALAALVIAGTATVGCAGEAGDGDGTIADDTTAARTIDETTDVDPAGGIEDAEEAAVDTTPLREDIDEVPRGEAP